MVNQVPNYETDPQLADHLDALIEEVKKRGRLDEVDNLLTTPTNEQIANAIKDSINKINTTPPESSFGWQEVIFGDKRLLPIIYKQSIRNVIEMLVLDWTSNGDNVRLEEFELSNKLQDYQAMLGQLDAEIERDLGPFKASMSLIARGKSTGRESPNILIGRYPYRSGRGLFGIW